MDLTNLLVVTVGILADIALVVYLLRRYNRRSVLSIGGSTLLLGVVALAASLGLISGWPVWIVTLAVLIVVAGSWYKSLRPSPKTT